jgi:hypothetical protein
MKRVAQKIDASQKLKETGLKKLTMVKNVTEVEAL